ncbi:MAG: VOC family protein [Deltaproteobacteria bacterium]|nr:VOC family protein [Deltaproteobacteria bacterium]
MFRKIDHVEIIPGDMDRSLDFYVGVLGFSVKIRKKVEMPPMEEIVYLELNETVLELITVTDPAPAGDAEWQVGYRMIALEVEDMDRAIAYLKEKGIEVTWGPVALGPSKRAEIRDPDGLPIELRQW